MQNDCFGLAMTAASREAVEHYDEALRAFLGYRHDTGGHLKQALAAERRVSAAVEILRRVSRDSLRWRHRIGLRRD